MSSIQLNPPIPMMTPKGEGLAWVMIDYGIEYNLIWVVAIDATGEIWSFANPKVRALKNITQGRIPHEKTSEKSRPEETRKENREEGQEGRRQDLHEKAQEKMTFMQDGKKIEYYFI
jgi:hypothetical protein